MTRAVNTNDESLTKMLTASSYPGSAKSLKSSSWQRDSRTFVSLFAGIGGFDLGLRKAGFECVAQVEKDTSCQSILAKQFPDVPRFDDVRKFNADSIAVRPDWICGGFPCQDLSVAGRRAGLAGKRSGLWDEFRRIIAQLTPGGVLIENVPGLLSSNNGLDMGTVLRGLGNLGYGFAYRVLDAQWFGLAQRRKRVFIVGCLGNVRRAAEILFERESLPWDSPPSREARTRVAPCVRGGTDSGSNEHGNKVAFGGNNTSGPIDVATACNAHGGTGRIDFESETFIAANNTGAGFWTEGEQAGCLRVSAAPTQPQTIIAGALNSHAKRHGHAMTTQQAAESGHLVATLDMRQCSRGDKMTNNRPGGSSGGAPGTGVSEEDLSPTVCDSHVPAVAYNPHSQNSCAMRGNGGAQAAFVTDKSRALDSAGFTASQGGTLAVAFQTPIARNGRGQPKETTDALTSCEGGTHADSKPHVAYAGGVRRLTPRECERLQGFPDDWTSYGADGKELSDSARYRMLGNAVAVPNVEWIAKRMEASHA